MFGKETDPSELDWVETHYSSSHEQHYLLDEENEKFPGVTRRTVGTFEFESDLDAKSGKGKGWHWDTKTIFLKKNSEGLWTRVDNPEPPKPEASKRPYKIYC